MWLWRIVHGIELVSALSLVAAHNFSGIVLGVWVLFFYTLDHQRKFTTHSSATWKMVAAVTVIFYKS